MVVVEVLQLCLIFVTGVIACYTDIKCGIVQNKLILFSGVIGIVLNLIYYIVFARAFFIDFLKNTAFLVIISILMYLFHIWAGGDCKLSILLSLIFPAKYYWYYNNSKFNLWYFILLAFVVGFVYITVDSIFGFIRNRHSQNNFFLRLKTIIINYFKNVIYLSALGHIYAIFIGDKVQISRGVYFVLCVGFIFVTNKFEYLKNKYIVIVIFIFDIAMSVITKYLPISVNWINYLFLFVAMIIKSFAESYNYKRIKTENIKSGMVLSKKDSLMFIPSKVKGLPGVSDETLKSRITQEEADSIKRWKNSKYGTEILMIVRKVPFAAFIFIGLVLYFIVGGTLGCY